MTHAESILSLDPKYTEDLSLFKKDKYSIRLQTIVGCWVVSKNYIQQQIGIIRSSRKHQVQLVKICMKKITRKEAITAITSLVGKNVQKPKKFIQFIDHQDPKIIRLLQTIKQKKPRSFAYQILLDSTLSGFDKYIISHIKKYEDQLNKMNTKGGVSNIVDQQLKKRTKYYFGFIPANFVTHTTLMITLSLSIVCCCTCYKYSKRKELLADRKKKQKLLKGISPVKTSQKKPGRMMKEQ